MPPIEGQFPVHLIKIKDFKNVINDDDVCDPYVQLTLVKESQTSEVKVDAGGEVEYNKVSTGGRGRSDDFWLRALHPVVQTEAPVGGATKWRLH